MGKRKNWDQVGELVSKIKELGLTYKEGAERFGASVWELYEYNKRQNRASRHVAAGVAVTGRETGAALSAEGACAAGGANVEGIAGSPDPGGDREGGGLPSEVAALICSHRREHPRDGFRRIEQELKHRHHVVVSRKQIRRTLKAAGLLESCDSSFDGQQARAKGTRRFEASYPGELYQMDVSYIYLEKLPTLYLVLVVDDHSRFCVGAELCSDQKGDTLIGVFHNACVMHGRPQKLLTDQGSGFYTWSFSQTRFQQYLDGHRIEHIVCEPHNPQTQGKVERLIQTVQTELFRRVRFSGYSEARQRLGDYIHRYNYDRPHQSLGGRCPADRFYGVSGEIARLDADLVGRKIDTSKGLLVFRIHGRTLSAVCCSEGLQVYLDGVLLKEGTCDDECG